MNWAKEAESELRTYDARLAAKKSLTEEIAYLDHESVRIGGAASSSVPVKGGGSAWEDKQLNIIVRRDNLRTTLKFVTEWLIRVERALEQLDEEERLVMDRFFIHPAAGNLDRLCGELGLEKTAVYNRRDAALRHYTHARYGIIEF